jgi:hypothetical protein
METETSCPCLQTNLRVHLDTVNISDAGVAYVFPSKSRITLGNGNFLKLTPKTGYMKKA